MLTHKNVDYSQNISNKDVNYRRTCTSLWQLWLPYTLVTIRSIPVGDNIFGRSLLGPWQATGNGTDIRVSRLWRPSSILDQYMCVEYVVRKVAMIQGFLLVLHFFPLSVQFHHCSKPSKLSRTPYKRSNWQRR